MSVDIGITIIWSDFSEDEGLSSVELADIDCVSDGLVGFNGVITSGVKRDINDITVDGSAKGDFGASWDFHDDGIVTISAEFGVFLVDISSFTITPRLGSDDVVL